MLALRKKIYDTWHRKYHEHIKEEYDNRMEKSHQISNRISDLNKNEPTGLVNCLINSFKLNLARTQLKLHFTIQKTLLELHCLEIDFMDNVIKV